MSDSEIGGEPAISPSIQAFGRQPSNSRLPSYFASLIVGKSKCDAKASVTLHFFFCFTHLSIYPQCHSFNFCFISSSLFVYLFCLFNYLHNLTKYSLSTASYWYLFFLSAIRSQEYNIFDYYNAGSH